MTIDAPGRVIVPIADYQDASVLPANAPEATSLELRLKGLRPILDNAEVTEICINKPGEAFVLTNSGWDRLALQFADYDWCRDLAKLVAAANKQRIDETQPLLSTSLPTGQRIQIVLPPATVARHVSITIRRPGDDVRSLDDLEKTGSFRQCVSASEEFDAGELELLELKKHGRFKDFLRLAVQLKKNILVSGSTGTGKTTMTNGLLLEIPETERLITIEDAPELVLKKQPNHVRLFYSKGDQGLAKVTPKLLLESCLRMRPDRVFLSELRSDEAYDYLKVIVAHPGSITSIHASTARLALKQLMMYVKQSGAGLTTDDVRELTYMLVDVVMQFGHDGGHRIVKELWYEPDKKRQTAR